MGLTWQTTDLRGLTSVDDGPGARIEAWTAGIGQHGITIAGTMAIDVTQRPGGLSLSKNGITAVFSSYESMPAFFDESTGRPIDLTDRSNGLVRLDHDYGDIVLEERARFRTAADHQC